MVLNSKEVMGKQPQHKTPRKLGAGLACRWSLDLAKVGVEGSNPFARSKT
jgi:hypothetical protein